MKAMAATQAHPHISLTLQSEAATAQLMADLGLLLGRGDVVALTGDLGAGKTSAARALIRSLAGDETLEVPSPSFTLVQPYELPNLTLLHADFYRVSHADEIAELGLSPLPPDALVLIEWPERAPQLLPDDRIDIVVSHIAFSPGAELTAEQRNVTVTGHGRHEATVNRLALMRQVIDKAGFGAAARQRMTGDASTRAYARLVTDKQTAILMNMPRRPDGPPIQDGKSYSMIAHLAEDITPFVAMANGLRELGFSAPALYYGHLDAGFLVLEDLGNETFTAGDPPAPIAERYQAAVGMLAALHTEALPDTLPVGPQFTHRIPNFDLDAFMIELQLLLDWYLPDRGAPATNNSRADFILLWRDALEKPLASEQSWTLRDFHSPNLIWLGNRPGTARVGLLDFQDAMIGPSAYDLASLLQDARVDVTEDLEIALFARYARARREDHAEFDVAGFAETYAVMAAQRATKILGIFARLNARDGKPAYLKHQPRVWGYLNRALAHPALAGLRAWYAAHVPPPGASSDR
jgi:tRNA threonylcarbamoyl adenosine modification protein YjeE